ncbi:MAG: ABC transporter substrate-binding protein [Spirochaetales bacterium]|nr:ABC transporter substrate-binding protein [Spirochaetales bacterium]
MKRKVVLVLCLLMTFSMVFANGKGDKGAKPEEQQVAAADDASSGTLPRNQTLYWAGLQWGSINGWNVLSDDMNNFNVSRQAYGTRITMFETLYMYNFLDGSLEPLLADGAPQWNANKTEVTVKIKKAAKWSDGTPVTAEDVAYSYNTGVKIGNTSGNSNKPYIAAVEAKDAQTVVIKAALNSAGAAKNPLMLDNFIAVEYVAQKAWIQKLEARTGGDATKMKTDPAEDVVYSGPYGPYFADDQKVVLVRNDNYWGKDASMWGKLPAPKYVAHTIYSDNAAGEVAFKSGEVDVSQQFNSNVQDLWEKDGLPISTYMAEAPYGICGSLPTAYYNLAIPGLDNVNVRKAIAMAVDYDAIIANAMTNQSPTFDQVPRSTMNPTPGEQALYDQKAVANLQWVGNDIAGANALLDKAGIKDTNGDGIRELNGKKLSFKASCPNGWTDWMAAIEIVAAAGEKIGIEITSVFPEWSVYQTVITQANQTEYEIFMMWSDGSSPTMPWNRVRQLMSSEYVGVEGNWSGNWGQYSNPRVDEIISAIPATTDAAKLRSLYTEANKIYLTDVPSFTLMYRPNCFHAVNESVWTNYPEDGDGQNIPPGDLIHGYSIAGLYTIKTVK